MSTLLKVVGWILLVPSGLFLVMLPFMLMDGETSAVGGLIFIVGFFGVPGGLLLRAGKKREAEAELGTQMVGFVRSRDAFTVAELAAHIGKSPAEAEQLLSRDIARYHLPLTLHRSSQRYLRLDRLSQTAQVAEQCQSCGGSLGSQVVFEGEQLTCPYCHVVVATHAPVPVSPNWQAAQAQPAQHHQQHVQHHQQHVQHHQQHAQHHQQHAQHHQQHVQHHQQHHHAPNAPNAPQQWRQP